MEQLFTFIVSKAGDYGKNAKKVRFDLHARDGGEIAQPDNQARRLVAGEANHGIPNRLGLSWQRPAGPLETGAHREPNIESGHLTTTLILAAVSLSPQAPEGARRCGRPVIFIRPVNGCASIRCKQLSWKR